MFIFHLFLSVNEGLSIKIGFEAFDMEPGFDLLKLYEGTGADKTLACEF